MRRKYFGRFLYGIGTLLVLTSCGGDKAGGTAEFATVFAVAGSTSGQLDSDVATWTGDACAEGSTITTEPDTIDFEITSTAYATPDTGQTSTIQPSPLSISRVTLTLTPADTVSPVLPSRFQVQFPSPSAPQILPNSTAAVPVRIVDNDLKQFLLSGLGAQSITCSNNVTYTYRAEVSFELLETTTNRVATVSAPGFVLVKFSDFEDL